MLRKRARSHQKEQRMNNLMAFAISDSFYPTQKHGNGAFLNVPGKFVGFNPKNTECDSSPSPSPTSPLDFRIFSSLSNPFRHPRVSQSQKSWECQKVGLSIVDSLDDKCRQSKNVVWHSENKTILLGRQMSVKSLNLCSHVDNAQKGCSDVVFEIGKVEVLAHSWDDGYRSHANNLVIKKANFASFIHASEIELSEYYTCVKKHGSNPKIIHIFGDCILECHNEQVTNSPTEFDFLKFCYSCSKKLDGLDIYMYRGEKAFCSSGCRAQEIENDQDTDMKTGDDPSEASDLSITV